MLKKVIKYVDYNGKEREDVFYFNLSKSEIAEMELSTEGGLHDKLLKIIETSDVPSIMAYFKEIILKSYGVKSDDGLRFRKTDDNGVPLSIAFSESVAFSELYTELAFDEEAAAAFVNGVIPADMSNTNSIPESIKTTRTKKK